MALSADVSDVTLAKLINGLGASIRQPGGSILTEYQDGQGKNVSAGVPADKQAALGKATEFEINIRVNPDGASASAKIVCKSPRGIYSIEGAIDNTVLATKLV